MWKVSGFITYACGALNDEKKAKHVRGTFPYLFWEREGEGKEHDDDFRMLSQWLSCNLQNNLKFTLRKISVAVGNTNITALNDVMLGKYDLITVAHRWRNWRVMHEN